MGRHAEELDRKARQALIEISRVANGVRVPIQQERSQDPAKVVVDRAILLMAMDRIEWLAAWGLEPKVEHKQ